MGKHVAKKKLININTEALKKQTSRAAAGSAEAVAGSASKLSRFIMSRSEGITSLFRERLTYDKKLPDSADIYILAACLIISLIVSFIPSRSVVFTIMSLVIVLVCGRDLLPKLRRSICSLSFYNQETIVLLIVIGCFCSSRAAAGAFALCCFQAMRYTGSLAHDRCTTLIETELPKTVLTGDLNDLDEKPLEEIAENDIIYIDKDAIIPVDGIVERGTSSVDHDNISYIGLSEDVGPGSYVYAGDRNTASPLAIRVLRPAGDSVMDKLCEKDSKHDGPESAAEKRIDRIASAYPAVVLAGLFIIIAALFAGGKCAKFITVGLAVLIVACNSLDFSKMLYSYVYAAFRRMGIVASDKAVLEKLPDTDTFVFRKSGIITDGSYRLNDVRANGCTKEDVLRFAAAAEKYSKHPIAIFLKNTVSINSEYTVKPIEELPGNGISSFVNGRLVSVGNSAYMEAHNVAFTNAERPGIVVHVAVDNYYAGCFVLNENTADGAYDCMEDIKSCGAGQVVVITGSSVSSSKQATKDLGVDMLKCEQTVEDKKATLAYLSSTVRAGSYMAYVCKSPDDDNISENADISYLLGTEDIYNGLSRAKLFCFENDISAVGKSFRKVQKIRKIQTFGTAVPAAADIAALALVVLGIVDLNIAALIHFGAAMFSYISIRGTDR